MFERLKRRRLIGGQLVKADRACSFCQMHYEPLFERSDAPGAAGVRICHHCAQLAATSLAQAIGMASRRPAWLRYSLRTAFIAVTLLAVWLAWNVNVVLQRKAMRRWIDSIGGRAVISGQSAYSSGESYHPWLWREADEPRWRLNFWRKLMGDQPIHAVILPPGIERRDVHRVQRLFPEVQSIHSLVEQPVTAANEDPGSDSE